MSSYLSLFLLLLILLRCIFWLFAPPNPDEAYYWLWGQHLDFSYYDHPPLQSWLQGWITAWFGKSLFTLRSLNLLTNGIFFYTYYCILRYLYGDLARRYIWWVILAILASPLYSVMLSLAWHDHLAITLSLLGAYLCIRFLDEYLVNGKGTNWRLYGSAIALSLDDKIGNFETGKEADFVVLNLQSTPILALRNQATNYAEMSLGEISDQLFATLIMGDDRAIAATYIMGELAHTTA